MSDTVRAALWMIGAIVSFTSMAVAGRELSDTLDTFEIMLFRSLIGFGAIVLAATVLRRLGEINRQNLGLHITRNVFHFTGQNLWFFAITAIPLSQVFALEFTLPLWAMLLAVVVLGEKLTWNRVATGLVGFAGVLMVTQPWAMAISAGVIAAAFAAIGFAGSAVFTRLLTRNHSIMNIMFWLTGLQLVFGLVCAGFDADIALPKAGDWPWVLVLAAAGLVAHFSLTKALSLASAAVVTPIDFARLPLIIAIGTYLYDEPTGIGVLFGAILIFAANYTNILIENRRPVLITK